MLRANDMRVLIVGGGIAGLGLSVALRRAGIGVELVEIAQKWAPVGAGIVLGVNAMKVMRLLGVADALEARSYVLGEMAIADSNDRVLGRTDLASLQPRFGKSLAMHRAVLHDVLLEACGDLPIRLATTVDEIDQSDDSVGVRFSDGTKGSYDLVVGADGLRSRVRELVFGEIPLSYSGYTCWRIVVDRPSGLDFGREMWGRGLRFGIVPVDDSRVYCFAVANAPLGTPDPEEGSVERFHDRFSVFAGPVPEILQQVVRPDQLIHNDLIELVNSDWTRSRVVLIGDAAHAMTPNMGQGAAMALEDVAVLAEVLAAPDADLASDPIASRVQRWFARRKSRVDWVQNQSRRIGRIAQWENPLLCSARDTAVRLTPNSVTERTLVRMAEEPL